MSASPFEHPWLSGLLGDAAIQAQFSADADLAAMLRFEAALAKAEAAEGLIPPDAADTIGAACESFAPDMSALRQATARDGAVVPEFVRQLRRHVGEPHAVHVHHGSTTQDVIDTSLVLRLKACLPILDERLAAVIDGLDGLERAAGTGTIMGRTRMRVALPVTVADKIAIWRTPVIDHRAQLAELAARVLRLQFGGAVGTMDKFSNKGPAIARRIAAELGLAAPDGAWHTARGGLSEFAGWLSLVSGALGKIGQDVTLLAQDEVGAITLLRGGGSSAMAHKVNPVAAETLITLARFNATQVAAMHQALVHENERSGTAWTLEWMILPQMAVATGAALVTATDLLGGISFDPRKDDT